VNSVLGVRYGLLIDNNRPVADITAEVQRMADAGIALAGTSQIFGYDALTLFAVVGQQVPDIELMTAVVPTYPRHPIMLAGQALTVQAAIGERLTLGIGLSHKVVIEGVYGYSFDRPVRHMREYLEALVPLLHGQNVSVQGETVKASAGPLDVRAPAPDVVVAALGSAMLELAGTLADGTATWMTGRRTIAEHTVPTITAAAEAAERKVPRVSVGLPVCVTADTEAAREAAGNIFSIYGQLPSYRAMLDREGADGPADMAVVGDEESVAGQLAAFADAGATELMVAAYGSRENQSRTFDLVAELSRAAGPPA
jgi:F420-dependent oxidoreductase-like protein